MQILLNDSLSQGNNKKWKNIQYIGFLKLIYMSYVF